MQKKMVNSNRDFPYFHFNFFSYTSHHSNRTMFALRIKSYLQRSKKNINNNQERNCICVISSIYPPIYFACVIYNNVRSCICI